MEMKANVLLGLGKALATGLALFAGAAKDRPDTVKARVVEAEVVIARQVVARDENGSDRAELAVRRGPDGQPTPILRMTGPNSRNAFMLGVQANAVTGRPEPMMVMGSADGAKLVLDVTAKGAEVYGSDDAGKVVWRSGPAWR